MRMDVLSRLHSRKSTQPLEINVVQKIDFANMSGKSLPYSVMRLRNKSILHPEVSLCVTNTTFDTREECGEDTRSDKNSVETVTVTAEA